MSEIPRHTYDVQVAVDEAGHLVITACNPANGHVDRIPLTADAARQLARQLRAAADVATVREVAPMHDDVQARAAQVLEQLDEIRDVLKSPSRYSSDVLAVAALVLR